MAVKINKRRGLEDIVIRVCPVLIVKSLFKADGHSLIGVITGIASGIAYALYSVLDVCYLRSPLLPDI